MLLILITHKKHPTIYRMRYLEVTAMGKTFPITACKRSVPF